MTASEVPGKSAVGTVQIAGATIIFTTGGGQIVVDPATLQVTIDGLDLVDRAQTDLGAVTSLSAESTTASWQLPDLGLDVTATLEGARVSFTLAADRRQQLRWPRIPATAEALQIPCGEGLDVPTADPFWNEPQAGLINPGGIRLQDLTLPVLGFRDADFGGSLAIPSDIGSTVYVSSDGGRLSVGIEHDFDPDAGTHVYIVAVSATNGSPIAAALDYRRWLQDHQQLGNLTAKIAANPEAAKLIGAFHAYLWGDGCSVAAIEQLGALGIDKMWLGYDDAESGAAEVVRQAQAAGYLVARYDSFDNGQDPTEADQESSRWPEGVFPADCVYDGDGRPVTGFGGRGCYLSSQALAQRPGLITERIARATSAGELSYFLDVDATGETFRDFSADHPMTEEQDRRNRLDRMSMIAEHYVFGSETVGGWANMVPVFSHGSSTPMNDRLWEAEQDEEFWGAYWGENGPDFFLKPVELPADLVTAAFDPRYRIPMYEAALHDSVISTDRWELPVNKTPVLTVRRVQLAMLYNTPLIYALNLPAIEAEGPSIARLQRFFAKIQQAAGTEPMTDFQWLTPDRLVQRTEFAGTLTSIANFSEQPYVDQVLGTIEPGCVVARIGTTNETLCQ
ncbi:glycoside hydrolase [Nocardia sp. CA-128927]|uniref:glycoside hydrolase n=1 Tax=Nocardia sp. CA-128927 TaxID=3239975 RepID=UPI003D97684A